MSVKTVLAAFAAAAICVPAFCQAPDFPKPPQDGEQPKHGGGPGQMNPFMKELMTPEMIKLIDDYKANPNDETKAKLKSALAEKYDAFLKEREAKLAEQKKNRDADIDKILERIASGKTFPPQQGEKEKGKGKKGKSEEAPQN